MESTGSNISKVRAVDTIPTDKEREGPELKEI